MKIIASICVSLLLWAGTPTAARGEDFRTDINPALLYYQAFMLAPGADDPRYQYFVTNDWYGQGQLLPAQFGELVSGYDTEMRYLHLAAAQAYPCDWGIDMSPGPEALLPELARCKQAALAAQFHVMWKVQQGDEDAAVQDIMSMLVLGRNTAHDRTLIGALVEIAIENIACATVAQNFGHFSPASLQKLADGFASAPERGTIASSFASERFTGGHWLRNHIEASQNAHPGDDEAVMSDLQKLINRIGYEGETNYWQNLTNSAGGTVAGMIKLSLQSELFTEQLSHILTLPHGEFETRISQFSDEVKKSGNYLTGDALNAWPTSRRKEFTIVAELAMVRAAIEYKLHGEAGFNQVPDPFGQGPFSMERFSLDGVDRGFKLTSAYSFVPTTTPPTTSPVPVAMIFVEKDGPALSVQGVHVGTVFKP